MARGLTLEHLEQPSTLANMVLVESRGCQGAGWQTGGVTNKKAVELLSGALLETHED